MSGGPVSVDRYRRIVGDQALEFERRLHEAGVRVVCDPDPSGGWCVTLVRPDGASVARSAPMLSTALYLAAHAVGLTTGLVPPSEGVSW